MSIKTTDLVELFENALSGLDQQNFSQIGYVIQVGDNFVRIQGLDNCVLGELVEFEGGNTGIVMNLDEESVSVFLLKNNIPVNELETVKRTGNVFKIPVGDQLLSRVINGIGLPIDMLGDITTDQYRPIEANIPGIIQRKPINEPLKTGILAIDALVPIGKGQRELIVGNRDTGKTAVVVDMILNQKNENVICVYVSVGQRQAVLARIADTLAQAGAMKYTCIVSANAGQPALERYLAPYVGCTIAEYFRDQLKDVLLIFDDLSSHAIAYREMSLLMRRAPGREAYPGDVFYLHSRLLERAGRLEVGGSITAIPIVQIQSDDITAYIPTNLISITDGQIFLDTKLFNNGIRPAINIELSVSRVASSAQTPAIKMLSKGLRLELAQYNDLLAFAQFGTELDYISQKHLEKGKIIVELLKQPQNIHYQLADQIIILFSLTHNHLDNLPLSDINRFTTHLISYVKAIYHELYDNLNKSGVLDETNSHKLNEAIKEFKEVFI